MSSFTSLLLVRIDLVFLNRLLVYRGCNFIVTRGANEVIGANYAVTTPFFKPLLIF
jgi:hypothetical protein